MTFKSGILWQLALAVILLAVYTATLLPAPGDHPDTAKFEFVGYTLGVSHAPGYPAYTILTHFFTRLFPWGSVAYRTNLFSAILSILTCLILFRILKLFDLQDLIAFISTLTFGFTHTFWSQSIIAEVYTLNAFFVAFVLYFFLRWNATRSDRFLLIACAGYALSFGNHLTMITFLPAIVYLVLATDPKVFLRPKLGAIIAGFIILGALQYYYPIWRYYDRTTLFVDMQTANFSQLLYSVTGGHFKPLMFAFSASEVLTRRIPTFLRLIGKECLFLIPVMLFGLFKLKNKVIQIFLLLAVLGNLFFALNYNIPDIFVYLIPTYLILTIYFGIGLKSLADSIPAKLRAITLCLPLVMLLMNYWDVNQHYNTIGEQAKVILNSVGENAVVFGRGKNLPRMYFFYYLFGEGFYRKQIYVVKFNQAFVDAYLFHKHPYRIREMRKAVPPGLQLYCTTRGQQNALRQLGLTFTKMGNGVFRVDGTPVKRPMRISEEEPDE
jgi:Protein O-mannosyl-transferase TMEM260-like